MAYHAENMVLYGAIETTPDTAIAIGSTAAIHAFDITSKIYDGDKVEIPEHREFRHQNDTVNASPHNNLSFSVHLAGSGTAGTAPAYDHLLRACGLSPTTTADTDVTYDPVSEDYESCTLHHVEDGDQHYQSSGVRGDLSIQFNAKQLPKLVFSNMLGTYTDPATLASDVTADYTNYKIPEPFTKGNTATLTLDGYSAVCESISFNLGNGVEWRDVVNSRGAIITNRKVSGEIKIEATKIATKNWWSILKSHAGTINKVALVLEHGTAAGKKIRVECDKVQFMDINKDTMNGQRAYVIPFICHHTSGDDEIALIIK